MILKYIRIILYNIQVFVVRGILAFVACSIDKLVALITLNHLCKKDFVNWFKDVVIKHSQYLCNLLFIMLNSFPHSWKIILNVIVILNKCLNRYIVFFIIVSLIVYRLNIYEYEAMTLERLPNQYLIPMRIMFSS